MINALRDLDPGQPLWRVLWFRLCHTLVQAMATIFYRLRVVGGENVPMRGPLLVIGNHQSHLDPPLIGVALHRRHIVPIARHGLFTNRALAWLIRSLNAIRIRENEGDTAAIRSALAELEHGRCILIFPEGSRSRDGSVGEFKRGAWLLLARARCTVLPVAIEGAFEAWPRSRALPRLWRQKVMVRFGTPVDSQVLRKMGADRGLAFLRGEVDSMRASILEQLNRVDSGSGGSSTG